MPSPAPPAATSPALPPAAREYVVVGAGISGLYAALLLARAGRRVRILERGSKPGGLAGAEHFRGLPCDLGSHRLHPAALERPLFQEMHRELPFLTRPRRGVLVLGERHLPYPLSAFSLARGLGLTASARLGLGLLARTAQRRAFRSWERERGELRPLDDADAGFERFVIERVGEAAYHAFYRPYAEKVWGIAPSDLSQTVARKRVSSTEPWRLLRSFTGRAAAFLEGRPPVDLTEFLYPPGGASSIAAFLERRLATAGVAVEYGRAYRAEDGDGKLVLFAGDLADLVPTPLEHRGLYLVYLALPVHRVADRETYYCPDPRYWFGRVSELQNYAPELRSPGETVLCVEIPEGAWGRGIDFTSTPRLTELLDQLTLAGILPRRTKPLEVRQVFVPNVYPLYRRGWLPAWRRAMRHVAALGNVLPFGRQALFLHCNIDHCADIAADAVTHAESGGRVEDWLAQAERYLSLRVRD